MNAKHDNQDPYRLAFKYLMQERNWSFDEVANHTGLKTSTLEQFSCSAKISVVMLLKLVKGFDYDSPQAFLEAGNRAAQKFNALDKDQDPYRKALKRCMQEQSWSFRVLAENTHLNQGTLEHFSCGHCNVSPGILLKLAEGFGYESTQAFVRKEKTVFERFPKGVLTNAVRHFMQETGITTADIAKASLRPEAEVAAFIDSGEPCNYRVIDVALKKSAKDTVEDFILAYTPEGKVRNALKERLEKLTDGIWQAVRS